MGLLRRLFTPTPTEPAAFAEGDAVKYRLFYETPMLYGHVTDQPSWDDHARTWFYPIELTRESKTRYAKYAHLRCWADTPSQFIHGDVLQPWDGGDQCEVCACGEIHE